MNCLAAAGGGGGGGAAKLLLGGTYPPEPSPKLLNPNEEKEEVGGAELVPKLEKPTGDAPKAVDEPQQLLEAATKPPKLPGAGGGAELDAPNGVKAARVAPKLDPVNAKFEEEARKDDERWDPNENALLLFEACGTVTCIGAVRIDRFSRSSTTTNDVRSFMIPYSQLNAMISCV